MLCRKCKKEIPDASTFCNHCGTKQSAKKGRRQRANGMGTAYKRGNTWTASVIMGWKDKDGSPVPVKRTKGGFATKTAALGYCATLKGEKKKERLSLLSQYEQWTSSRKFDELSESKRVAYRIAFDKLEPIHAMDIGEIRLEDIQPIVDSIATYYPARDVRQVLSHLFRPAVVDGRAEKNYAEYVDLPEKPLSKKDAFTKDEVARLWKQYEADSFTGYVLLMIYSGMALGELQNVRCENIDFMNSIIRDVGTKNKLRKETPIYICALVAPVLERLCKDSVGSLRLLTIGEENFYARYYETLEAANCRRLTPHCCRHTTATALAEAGVQPAIIKAIMRHSKYQTTTEYTHIDPQIMLKELDKILVPTTY